MAPRGNPQGLGGRIGEVLSQNIVAVLDEKADHFGPGISVARVHEDLGIMASRLVDLLSEVVAPLSKLRVASGVTVLEEVGKRDVAGVLYVDLSAGFLVGFGGCGVESDALDGEERGMRKA